MGCLSCWNEDVSDEGMFAFCIVSAGGEVCACSRYGVRIHLPASCIVELVHRDGLRGAGVGGAWGVGQAQLKVDGNKTVIGHVCER